MLKIFERLPLVIVLGVLFLALCFGTLVLSGDKYRKKLALHDGPPLSGIEIKAEKPRLSLHTLMDGSFQKSAETLLNDIFPFRSAIIRATNQVYYSLFARSYMYRNEVVIGKQQYLYETIYLQHYCNMLRENYTQEKFDKWAKNIESIGDFFMKRGQTFVFVLTPSKAAYYPEYLPKWAGCSGQPPRPDYFLATTALRRTHVPTSDLSKLVIDAKGKYPIPLFTRGGTHWNMLAVALSVGDIREKINRQGKWILPEIRFSYSIDNNPDGLDADLLYILNLQSPDHRYQTAKVRFDGLSEHITHAPRIAIVGSSFMRQIFYALRDTNMFESVDYYYYLMLAHNRYPELKDPTISPNAAEYYRELLAADIVILEVNEANMESPHVNMLEEALARYAGRANGNTAGKYFTQDILRPCTSSTRIGC